MFYSAYIALMYIIPHRLATVETSVFKTKLWFSLLEHPLHRPPAQNAV